MKIEDKAYFEDQNFVWQIVVGQDAKYGNVGKVLAESSDKKTAIADAIKALKIDETQFKNLKSTNKIFVFKQKKRNFQKNVCVKFTENKAYFAEMRQRGYGIPSMAQISKELEIERKAKEIIKQREQDAKSKKQIEKEKLEEEKKQKVKAQQQQILYKMLQEFESVWENAPDFKHGDPYQKDNPNFAGRFDPKLEKKLDQMQQKIYDLRNKYGLSLGGYLDTTTGSLKRFQKNNQINIEDKAYFDGGYFRTAATPLSLFTKDLRETLRRFAAIVNCPIKGFGNLTTQNEFSNKINQLKTWVAADIAKMENDKLKETFPAMAIHRHHWIRDRKEVIAELKKIEDTKISLLPTVAKNAKPVEDKAYFDRRIYHSTGTFHTLLDKETRVPIDGTSKWVTVDPAQYITPRRVRISGIKGEIEIAAQLSGNEITRISAKAVKATAARQGSKSKFAFVSPKYEREDSWLAKITDKAERAYTTISQLRERLSSLQNMLQRTPPGTARTELEAYYKTQIQAMSNAKKEYEQAIKHSRTGTKSKFAATRIWPNDYGEINNANAKYARLIFDRQKIIRANAGRRIKGEQPLEVPAPPTAPEFPFAFADGDYVGLVLGGQANVPKGATVKWAHNANSIKMSHTGTKSKFANRGAFAEASSSPVLGSLLEKKVMPEGGWRAVETDGGALVIAFEDGDIAGNFARRASENGYSATAPMAMAGRFWNVKVQNENKQ